jgi:hypothetical protein
MLLPHTWHFLQCVHEPQRRQQTTCPAGQQVHDVEHACDFTPCHARSVECAPPIQLLLFASLTLDCSKRGAAGFGAAANLLLGDCFCDELAGSLHGQAAGDTASNQLAAWHGWCTFW